MYITLCEQLYEDIGKYKVLLVTLRDKGDYIQRFLGKTKEPYSSKIELL